MFIDSNIWCYYFDSSVKEHEPVSEELERVLEEEDVYLNTVIVMEVAHYLVKNLGAVKGKEKVEKLLEFPFKVVDLDYTLMTDSIDSLAENTHTGIGGRDATILAAMEHEAEEKLLTHDQAFKNVDGIEVVDPV